MEKDTPDFLNKVVVVLTDLKPKELLKATQKIEKKLGRKTKSINQKTRGQYQ